MKEMRQSMWFRLYCLGIVVICLVTVFQLPNAYYHREIKLEDLKCKMGKDFLVEEKNWEKGEGVFVTGPGIALDKGDYLITVSYAASSQGNYVTVETDVNPETVENREPQALPQAPVWGGLVVPLHLDSYTEDLDFTIYYGGSGDLKLFDIVVDGKDFRPGDILVIGFLVLFFYILTGIIYIYKEKKQFLVFSVLLLTSLAASYPYFSSILYHGDDIEFHLMRIVGIRDGLLAGQFPVRVYPSAFYGTGYDSSLYYPDIFLYIPALLCLAGVSLAAAVQIFSFFFHFAAAWIMYYAARKMGGRRTAGLICAVLYVFCGYFGFNLYFRFDLGECIAMCFFPLVICGFYAAVFQEEGEWRPLCLGMAGLVLSHILSAFFAVIFLVLFGICFYRKIFNKNVILTFLKAAGAAFALCAWFLVPLWEEYKYRENTNIVNMAMSTDDNVLQFGDLIGGFKIGYSQSLGTVLALGAFLCLYCFCSQKIVVEEHRKKQIFVLWAAGLFSAVCTTALFPWKDMIDSGIFHNIIALIQFPWRLLGPASAFLSLAAGLVAVEVFQKISGETLLAAVFLCCFLCFSFQVDTYEHQKDDIYLRHGDAIQTTAVAEDYLIRGTHTRKLKDLEPEIAEKGMKLLEYEKKGSTVKMRVSAEADSYVDTTLLLFDGYQAFDESGKTLPCIPGDNGRLRVQFSSAYEGDIMVRYTGHKIWRVFDIFSILSLFALAGSWILKHRAIKEVHR